jgi:dTDP-4-amino-4,6-dideoxygalactose transaminase
MTEDIAAREVTLPLYPGMTDEHVAQVVEAVAHSLAASAVETH